MATRNFRVGELEIKPNYTSLVRGYNYDSRFYLNDKDAPTEDTQSEDWTTPGTVNQPCTPPGPGTRMPDFCMIYDRLSQSHGWLSMRKALGEVNPLDGLYPFISRNTTYVGMHWMLIGDRQPISKIIFDEVARENVADIKLNLGGDWGTYWSPIRAWQREQQVVGVPLAGGTALPLPFDTTAETYVSGQTYNIRLAHPGFITIPVSTQKGWSPPPYVAYYNAAYRYFGMISNFGPNGSNFDQVDMIPPTGGVGDDAPVGTLLLPGKGNNTDSYDDYYWALISFYNNVISNSARLHFGTIPMLDGARE